MKVFASAIVAIALAACGAPAELLQAPHLAAGVRSSLVSHHLHVIPFLSFRGHQFGSNPVPGLIGDSSDNLYGVTQAGGSADCTSTILGLNGCGVVYQLTHVNGLQYTESVIHSFVGRDGAFPDAPLAGGNGIFFGTTSQGGPANMGTVFAIDVNTKRFRTLYAFSGGSDGAFPIGRLYVDGSGNLFGTTAFGGKAGCTQPQGRGCGTVFELERSGSNYKKTTLYRFSSGSDGWEPWAGVTQYKGELYGTTLYGGNGGCKEGCGTLFELARSGAKRTVHAFAGSQEGAYVKSPLYVDSAGNFYGETQNGGDLMCRISDADDHGCGTIFKVTPTPTGSKIAVLHHFHGGLDGAQPNTGLTQYNGVLYGTTIYGGNASKCGSAAAGCGIAFNVNPDGSGYGVMGPFAASGKGGAVNPALFLCVITGELNGVTSSGGTYGYGTIFKLIPS